MHRRSSGRPGEAQAARWSGGCVAPLELRVIRHRPRFRPLNFLDSVVRTSKWARISVGRRSLRQTHLAMNLLLLLALAVPLSCLAFLSLLALLGVATLGAVIHVPGAIRARWPQWLSVEQANNPTGSYLHQPSAKRNGSSFDHLVGAARARAIRRTGVTEYWIGTPRQSALMLAARITLA